MKTPLRIFALAALGSLLFLTAPAARGSETFAATGSLAGARREHTSTLLPTGKVLVVGGRDDTVSLVTAQLNHPAAGTWAATGALGTERFGHTATLLPGGKVLVVGGWNGFYVATAELYDPAGNGGAGSWTPTASPAVARIDHTATLLANGKVLVTGGQGSVTNPGGEVFDPAGNGGAGTWTATGPFVVARYRHSATRLASGQVLVAGGFGSGGYLASAELYDPAANTWTATGSLATGGRDFHTATRLPDGKVLVAGGRGGPGVLATAELYDPVATTWSATGSLGTARFHHTATLLTSGRVLVAGGSDTGGIDGLSSAELYDPASAGTWQGTGPLAGARQDHTATLLPGGQVLVAGGFNGGLYLTTAELYDSPVVISSSMPAGTSTPIPGGTGTFLDFGAPSLSLGSTVVFGTGSGGQEGIYRIPAVPASPIKIADLATAIPGGTGLFTEFCPDEAVLQSPTISGNKVAFFGMGASGQQGIYVGISPQPIKLADLNTAIPGGTGNFSGFSTVQMPPVPMISGNLVAFFGIGAGGQQGIYAATVPSQLVNPSPFKIADLNTAIPGGVGNFTGFVPPVSMVGIPPSPMISGNNVAFIGLGAGDDVQMGVYLAAGIDAAVLQPMIVVADLNTAIPGGTGTFQFFQGLALDGTKLVFTGGVPAVVTIDGTIPGQQGVYKNIGAGLQVVADLQTPVPGTALPFSGFGAVAMDPGDVVFVGFDQAGVAGLYTDLGGVLSKVVAVGDVLGGKTVASLRFAQGGFAEGKVVCTAVFTDGSEGLTVATLFTPPADLLVEQQPAGLSIADGDTADFPTTANGTPVSVTFTIQNAGGQNLTGLTITGDGADAADYAVTASPTAPVPAFGTTTCTVRFLPTGGLSGLRNAAIHIASNAPGTKNPYNIHLAGQALSFTTDGDGDGLNDAAEFLLRDLGFDWGFAQPALVATLANNAYAAGLYTTAQVQALNVGVPLIQKDVVTGRFKLTIGVQKTPNLATVPFAAFPFNTPEATTVINGATGKLEFEFTVPDNAAFFRLQAQ